MKARYYFLWATILASAGCASLWLQRPAQAAVSLFLLLMVSMVLQGAYFAVVKSRELDPLDVDSSMPEEEGKVDPWQLQRRLMEISAQDLPARPMLTKHALMYSALIAEEASETFRDLVAPLDRMLEEARATWNTREDSNAYEALKSMRGHLRLLFVDLDATAKRMRHALGFLPNFEFPLTLGEAVELLDDASDTNVVTCGFSLASGLPGAAGYEETATSNLSKANPETGLIDKEPDGKWIKGRLYRKPQLATVISRYYPEQEVG